MNIRPLALLAFVTLLAGCSSSAVPANQSVSGNIVRPEVLQSGGNPTNWEVFPLFGISGLNTEMAFDKKGELWESMPHLSRFNISTLKLQDVLSNDGSYAMTSGPDGNMWICSAGFNQVYKIDPATLNVTTYSGVDCHSIASGPDGNLWLLNGGIIRLTTTGQSTTYSFPSGYSEAQHQGGEHVFAFGSDGNLWLDLWSPSQSLAYIANLNLSTGTFTIGGHLRRGNLFNGLVRISTALYSCGSGSDFGKIYKINTSGHIAVANDGTAACRVARSVQKNTIYFETDSSTNPVLGSYDVVTKQVATLGLAPNTIWVYGALFGPDQNVWSITQTSDTHSNGFSVYINDIISVVPSSATITVGNSQPFTASETNCQCVTKAVASDPTILQVSPVVNQQFSVKALKAGSATVTISDKHINSFVIPITAQ